MRGDKAFITIAVLVCLLLLAGVALAQAGGNQANAAQMLGIPRTTLRDKIAKYGLTRLRQAE